MTLTPAQLLRRLEPAVRPVDGGRTPAPRPPLERRTFPDLLQLVAEGGLSSERPVRVDPGRALEPEQLRRLAAAADLAEAEGARTALMLLDGRALVMDVAGRTVAEELDPDAPAPIVRLDAAVYVPQIEARAGPAPAGPRADVLPPALAAALRPMSNAAAEPAGGPGRRP